MEESNPETMMQAAAFESTSVEDNEPVEQIWHVYEFLPLGSLEDLLIYYFGSEGRKRRTLQELGVSDPEIVKS